MGWGGSVYLPHLRLTAVSFLYISSHLLAPFNTHVIVRPQLQTTGADTEDAGEKLIRFKEVWDMKVLRQVWELFAQISRFLVETTERWREREYLF